MPETKIGIYVRVKAKIERKRTLEYSKTQADERSKEQENEINPVRSGGNARRKTI